MRQVVFARRELDRFLTQFVDFPKVNFEVPSKLKTISYVCQHGGGDIIQIIAHILERRLPAFRDPERPGLGGVLVSPEDAIALKVAVT